MAKLTRIGIAAAWIGVAAMAASCGGAGGGAGPGGSGQGLALLRFEQDGVDNLSVNSVLAFLFSEALDPASVHNASVQVREGDAFGRTVDGVIRASGARLFFEPRLPGVCEGYIDAGFRPDTEYRVQLIGSPEEFSLTNLHGQPLGQTLTMSFHTRGESDPELFQDDIPATPPRCDSVLPLDGAEAVPIAADNQVVLTMSENLDPCSIDSTSVFFHMYELGDPNVKADRGDGVFSGFSSDGTNTGSTADQTPGDPYTWGATGTTGFVEPQKIPARVELQQEFGSTRIVITPEFGKFQENALLVVRLSFEVRDFAGDPLEPFTMSFTTENTDLQSSMYVLENAGETPYDFGQTTADVDSGRAPGLVQGFMLFAGDGDNGSNDLAPSKPESNFPTCTQDYQLNSGNPNDYSPLTDEVLDTGGSPNLCPNSTDGSNAVVWEFNTLRIRDGVTVRVTGVNPAIILVLGDATIEAGGTLLLRGDGSGNGVPDGDGMRGRDMGTMTDIVPLGGVGVAGGGNGGDASKAENTSSSFKYGDDGNAGFGSEDFDPAMPNIDPNDPNSTTPQGAGQAGAPTGTSGSTYNPWDGSSEAGGGGGHATAGADGDSNQGSTWPFKLPSRGLGGEVYGDDDERLLMPQAGSGGGSAGQCKDQPWRNYANEGVSGGGGGAGGGFIDLTSNGNVSIFGTIDAAGGEGGDGVPWNMSNGDRGISGGGGGGSGGGVRVLTSNDIIVGASTVITTAGGAGGAGAKPYSVNWRNYGGAGGTGRIALEDSDSVISGVAAATLIPSEGNPGFYRSVFDATRFQGGGLTPKAVTLIFGVGPFNPMFQDPVYVPGGQEDFIAGIPVGTSPGSGKTAIWIEARGFQILPDATPDLTGAIVPPTSWHSVGYFTDSGVDTQPAWNLGNPPLADIGGALPPDNSGVAGFGNLDGYEFIQLRISMFLSANMSPSDPGPYIDRWYIRFEHDQ